MTISPAHGETGQCDLLYNLGMFEKALRSCQEEAEGGNGLAAYNLSAIHRSDNDTEKTVQWMLRAAELGHPQAQYALASAMNRDEQSHEKAETLYKSAAEQGHTESQLQLAQLYIKQGQIENALQWLHRAEQAGDHNALYMLGVLYSDSDPKRSVTYYKSAVEKGNPYAAHNLSRLYMTGEQVPQDYDKALNLIEQSIAQGVQQSARLKQEIVKRIGARGEEGQVLKRSRDWLFSQPEEHYVIQVGAFHSEANARRYIRNNGLSRKGFYYESRHNDKPIYIVLCGPFNSRENTLDYLSTLNKAVVSNRPYPKSFKTIRKRRTY